MSNINRRRFLEDSLFATAAAAVAGTASISQPGFCKDGANDKLRVAVLGINGRGRSHVDGFRKIAEIAMICDPDRALGQKMADQYSKELGYKVEFTDDPRKVMENKGIDVVSVATPNHWHALAAIWAMQAGKDVYCEKPVSHNVSEGRRIVEAARKYDKICQTGTQSRSNPGMREMIDFLHAGKLGKVQVARGLCYKPRKSIGKADAPLQIPSSVNYDVWAGPAPAEPIHRKKLHYDWHWQWTCGNGDLGNQGIHQVDLCRWGLGVDRLSDDVVSVGGRLGYVDDGTTPNTLTTFFNYGDQQLVFEVRGLKTDNYKGAGVGCVFHCEDGYLVMTSYHSGSAFDKDGKEIKKFKGGDDQHHYDNFVKAVRSRKVEDLNADIVEGHLSSAMCHLGNISYLLGDKLPMAEASKRLASHQSAGETLDRMASHLKANGVNLESEMVVLGTHLQVDARAENFPNNSQANALLTREYRKGFEVPEAGRV